MTTYIIACCGASIFTSISYTITSSMLIESVVETNPHYYLGREIPGQMAGLGISLLLAYKYKSHPMRCGVLTSMLYPLGVYSDILASKSEDPLQFMIFGSIIKSISYVGPTGAHTTSIVNICQKITPSTFGSKNMILSSFGGILGISTGLYLGYNDNKYIFALFSSILYPIMLTIGWRSAGLRW